MNSASSGPRGAAEVGRYSNRHAACIAPARFSLAEPSMSAELRRQETEFYEAFMAVLAAMPRGTTVPEALASDRGHRIRMKWMLKFGRRPPL